MINSNLFKMYSISSKSLFEISRNLGHAHSRQSQNQLRTNRHFSVRTIQGCPNSQVGAKGKGVVVSQDGAPEPTQDAQHVNGAQTWAV